MQNINTSTTVITPLADEDAQHTDIENSVTLEQLQQLVNLVDASDLAELEVRHGKSKTHIVLRKAAPVVGYAAPVPSPVEAETSPEPVAEQQPYVVTSQFVGFFQSWSKTKGQPLAKVGDAVKEGQHVAVVLSIGVPNEVEATMTGHIVELLAKDGDPVQYGQPLMTIMP